MSDYNWVGARLRERRLAIGLTIEELAERVGIPVSLVGEIENGNTAERFGFIISLAMELGVAPEDLLNKDDAKLPDETQAAEPGRKTR